MGAKTSEFVGHTNSDLFKNDKKLRKVEFFYINTGMAVMGALAHNLNLTFFLLRIKHFHLSSIS